MRFKLALEGNLERTMKAQEQALAVGVTRAVRETAVALQQALRQAIAEAGLGARLPRTVRVKHYPASGVSMGAASLVFSKAPVLLRVFGRGATIRSKSGVFLAIPTENAPKRGTGVNKRISPSNWPDHRFGPLRFVYRRSGPSLLVVDAARASFSRKTGQLRGFRKASGRARKTGKGLTTVVMFVLVPQVTIRRKFDLDAIAEQHRAALALAVSRQIAAEQRARGLAA